MSDEEKSGASSADPFTPSVVGVIISFILAGEETPIKRSEKVVW